MSVARSTTSLRGCAGKIIYASTKQATRACVAMKARTREKPRDMAVPYWCQHCEGYHVGRKGGRT